MASLVSALDTEFTPAVGDFNVQVSTGVASLLRKNSSGVSVVNNLTLFSMRHISAALPV